jgi:hypothetical protein
MGMQAMFSVDANENDGSSVSSSDDEESMEEIFAPADTKPGCCKSRIKRKSVCAEMYDTINKHDIEDGMVYPKTDEQKAAIKIHFKKNFMFNALDPKDTEIVIDAI